MGMRNQFILGTALLASAFSPKPATAQEPANTQAACPVETDSVVNMPGPPMSKAYGPTAWQLDQSGNLHGEATSVNGTTTTKVDGMVTDDNGTIRIDEISVTSGQLHLKIFPGANSPASAALSGNADFNALSAADKQAGFSSDNPAFNALSPADRAAKIATIEKSVGNNATTTLRALLERCAPHDGAPEATAPEAPAATTGTPTARTPGPAAATGTGAPAIPPQNSTFPGIPAGTSAGFVFGVDKDHPATVQFLTPGGQDGKPRLVTIPVSPEEIQAGAPASASDYEKAAVRIASTAQATPISRATQGVAWGPDLTNVTVQNGPWRVEIDKKSGVIHEFDVADPTAQAELTYSKAKGWEGKITKPDGGVLVSFDQSGAKPESQQNKDAAAKAMRIAYGSLVIAEGDAQTSLGQSFTIDGRKGLAKGIQP